jgi:hypothetical protein
MSIVIYLLKINMKSEVKSKSTYIVVEWEGI